MEFSSTDVIADQLLSTDSEFRELVRAHGRYESRLTELSALAYPSDEEQLEEITLKKKKLAVKDQIQAMLARSKQNTQSLGAAAN